MALAAAARYAAWRGTDHGHPLDPAGVDRAAARRLVEEVLADEVLGVAAPGAALVPVALDARRSAELLA